MPQVGKPKRKLIKVFSLMLSGVALVSILLIGSLWISFETNRSAEEIAKIRADYIAAHKGTISLETSRITDYIEAKRQSGEIAFFKSIKERVYEAFDLISSIDGSLEKLNIDRAAAQQMVIAGLKGIKFNKGRSRYFIFNEAGAELLDCGPSNAQGEQKSAGNGEPQLPEGFAEIIRSLARIKEGFFRYDLDEGLSTTGNFNESHFAYLKVFEPYNWIVGVSEDLKDRNKDIQGDILSWASELPLPDDTYLMIINYNGDILIHPDPLKVGTNAFVNNPDPSFQKVAAELIRGAKGRSKDFFSFNTINYNTGEPIERIGFFRSIPAWNWVVATWVFSSDIETALAESQQAMARNVRSQIINIVAISVSMLMLILIMSKVMSALASRSFAAFFTFFENAATSSTEINPDDQPFEEFARLALAANNMINQRNLAEELLRESELRFKTIFNVSPQVITISSPTGILLEANNEFKHFARLQPEEALSKPLEDGFPISSQTRINLWAELAEKGSLAGREVETTSPTGSPLTFLVFGKMIHMDPSSFILLIFTDITALKQAENEKLVLQEKLARSTKMEAMGLMAAEVAHDLNNILSGIIGYPQLLLMEPNITEKQKESLKEILETGQRAAAVVSDLLTIARGVASTKYSLPINSVVTDYTNSPECKHLQEIFPNVQLNLDLDANSGNIIASPVHLSKVVMNLISNAFEAMPPTKTDGVVSVKTQTVELTLKPAGFSDYFEPGHYALITVSDNGLGIPAEDIKKVFEPFYSKKAKGRSGTGLGLAIVWNTIIDHSGHITVESSPEGTTFKLYFKVTEEKTAVKGKLKKIENYLGNGQAILVVDDVDIQRKLAAKMLTTLGYNPVTVPSGEAAVEYLKQNDVSLVILDMIMHPGMNGRETYGAIMEFKPQQKAIIASGMAETDEVSKAQAMGAGQFVNKPYTIEDLAVAVQKALAGD